MKTVKERSNSELTRIEIEFSIVWILENPLLAQQYLEDFCDKCESLNFNLIRLETFGFVTFIGTPK